VSPQIRCPLLSSDVAASIIKEIASFVHAESKRGFIKLLLSNDDRVAKIEAYHSRLSACVDAFQVRGEAVWNRFI
jgi:hypothetical protein